MEKLKKILEKLKTKTKNNRMLIGAVLFLAVFVSVWYVSALNNTNINTEDKFAWSETGGWFNFGASDGGVMIFDSELAGYVWSENFGWISLNCSNNDVCATSNYKIANDGEGNLSGYAWGENVGFVNFAPSNGGVSIDSMGVFSGYAWGENIGWIVFNCQDLDVCASSDFKVATSWIPLSARESGEEDESVERLEVTDVNYSSTDSTITINWETNRDADSHVRWGTDKNLSEEKNEDRREEKHRTILKDLKPETQYFFRIKSTDSDGNSDTSKIHSISTKSSSAFFEKRQWESFDNSGTSKEEKIEEVEIEVSDKKEEIKEEIKKDSEEMAASETPEIEIPEQESTFFADLFASMKNGGVSVKNGIGGIFLSIGDGISGFFSGARDLALGGQRSIAEFFAWTGEKLAGMRNSFIALFNQEKAAEIARLEKAKYFTTEVFKRDDRKLLSQVRFQILDPSDNPIPQLETTLFSDPQTTVTDEDGIATFQDVPIGSHTLAFAYEGNDFRKEVAIADTLTEEGKVRAEIVEVRAEKERLAWWMWTIIMLLIVFMGISGYFARKYFELVKNNR